MSDGESGYQTARDLRPAGRQGSVLLRADHVVKEFRNRPMFRSGGEHVVHAVDDVSFELRTGETLGVVGPTGCGKSTLARCLTRLCDLTSGTVTFDGRDISTLTRRQLQPIRRQIQMVFQDPSGSLNPRRRVGSIIGDAFAVHRIADGLDRKRRVQELMETVGLKPEHYNRFPAEFSGGQRQRIGIARALALRPKLVICDEPVSALDVSIQAQVLNLLTDLQREFDLTYVLIAHDLSVVRHLSDRLAVMYLGQLVEVAPVDDVFEHAQHPYTSALLSAMPAADGDAADARGPIALPGEAPSPINPPAGCRFHPQCWKSQPICHDDPPELAHRAGAAPMHVAACHFPLSDQDRPDPGVRFRAAGPPVSRYPRMPIDLGHTAHAPSDDGARDEPTHGVEGRSTWQLASERLRHDRVAMGSLVVIGGVVLWALAAPLIARLSGHPVNEQFHETGQTPEGLPVGPRAEFWLGTDDLGRDLLVRIGYGLRVSLFVGLVATLATVTIGVVVGLVAGYFGGLIDTVLARLMDMVLAFPFLLLAVSVVAVLGPSVRLLIMLIALFSWAAVARIVRGQVLSIREKDYVEAARSVGSSPIRIMLVEILPNTLAPVIAYTTLLIPAVMILEASLSFLGVGIPPPTANIGAMLRTSAAYHQQAWWFIVFPGAALLCISVAFNLLGDAVRDALDPRGQITPATSRRR